jgi:hypothetical protein
LSGWVGIVRRILLANSLLEDHPIEPSASVKECCLAIASVLLPKLSQDFTTEDLDDLVASAAHSTNSNRLRLQEVAFPVLKQIIDLFWDRKTDSHMPLLSVYDSQFSQSVRVGFGLSLFISGGFLTTYLSFLSTTETNEYSSIIRAYIDGMMLCKQRNSAYYSLAASLCQIGRKRNDDVISNFLKEIIPVSEDIIFQAMKLWRNRDDWRLFNHFRDLAAGFYTDLLPSIIWLESIARSTANIEGLAAFMLIESQNSKEAWMSTAAYEAFPVMIEYFGKELRPKIIEIALKLAITLQGRPFIPILLKISGNLSDDRIYNNLREMLLSIVLNQNLVPLVIGQILKTDSDRLLRKYSETICVRIVKEFIGNRLTENVAIALFSMIFNHSPSAAGLTIELILQIAGRYLEFALRLLKICLPNLHSDIPLASLSRFCIENFKRGGMVLVGSLLLENPELGVALLSRGVAKAAFLLCANDVVNVRAYLRFVQVSLGAAAAFSIRTPFAVSVMRLAMEVIRNFGNDVQRGHQIISLCVQVFVKVKEIVGDEEFREEFGRSTGRGRVVEMMRLQIGKAVIREKNENLLAFSANIRAKRHEDEWQDLDASSSDEN